MVVTDEPVPRINSSNAVEICEKGTLTMVGVALASLIVDFALTLTVFGSPLIVHH